MQKEINFKSTEGFLYVFVYLSNLFPLKKTSFGVIQTSFQVSVGQPHLSRQGRPVGAAPAICRGATHRVWILASKKTLPLFDPFWPMLKSKSGVFLCIFG